jgi:hypothetical protein
MGIVAVREGAVKPPISVLVVIAAAAMCVLCAGLMLVVGRVVG